MTEKHAPIIWQHNAQPDPQAIPLDENGCLNKASILNRLKAAFQFPDYFGENWDAAYDLLMDQVDQLDAETVWRFSISRDTKVNEPDLAVWIQLMTDLCAYAEAQGLLLQVLIQQPAVTFET